METPFVFGRMATGADFTDREAETAQLEMNFRGLINTIIISPRRWGKTSLVNKCLENLQQSDEYYVAHVDIFNCRTEAAFYSSYANAVLKASATKMEELLNAAKKYLSAFAPSIKMGMGDIAQQVEISLGIDLKDKRYSFDEILDLPQTIASDRGKKFIVCIDEFQNVNDYDDAIGFQRVLRSHWQRHTNVGYCLYGSKRHMLMDIFGNYEMPFYKFGEIIFLDKIPLDKWIPFITKRFESTGKRISESLATVIVEKMQCHPYYVQQLCQQVWLRTDFEATSETVAQAFASIVSQTSMMSTTIIESLRPRQINFLLAIADGVKNFSSKEVLQKYDLGSSANIKNLKKAVTDNDIVDMTSAGNLSIQDPVFEYWLKHEYAVRR